MGKSGSGLGLAVVYGVIQDHYGYIDVQSVPQKGTTFTIHLPLNKRAPKPEVVPFSGPLRGTEKVLVVDDIQEQRELAQSFLKILGYKVKGAATGEQAIKSLRNDDADIVIIDMILGDGIDGLETYKRILDFKPKQKAIVVSGFAQDNRVQAIQKLGAGSYVQKPYTLDILGKTVRKELDKEKTGKINVGIKNR